MINWIEQDSQTWTADNYKIVKAAILARGSVTATVDIYHCYRDTTYIAQTMDLILAKVRCEADTESNP